MLLTLLQLHLLLVAPALTGWSWAALPTPVLSAQVQCVCLRAMTVQAVKRISATLQSRPYVQAIVSMSLWPADPAAAVLKAPHPAHAPRAP